MAQSKTTKRKLFDEDLSTINHAVKHAKIYAMIRSLSPMKTCSSGTSHYFDGRLCDTTSNLQLFGFESKHQEKLTEFKQNNGKHGQLFFHHLFFMTFYHKSIINCGPCLLMPVPYCVIQTSICVFHLRVSTTWTASEKAPLAVH